MRMFNIHINCAYIFFNTCKRLSACQSRTHSVFGITCWYNKVLIVSMLIQNITWFFKTIFNQLISYKQLHQISIKIFFNFQSKDLETTFVNITQCRTLDNPIQKRATFITSKIFQELKQIKGYFQKERSCSVKLKKLYH